MRDPARRPEVFRAVHRRFAPRLLGLLVRMCHGDRDQAEDLLGRSLYKAYVALAKPEGESAPIRSLNAWLYTVATRTALDEFARRDGRDPLDASVPLEEWTPGPAAVEQSKGLPGSMEAALEAVLERLDREDPRYRTLLEMEHVAACDRGEMAEATGIERRQLAQYLKRARTRFLKLAKEHPALLALAPATAASPKEVKQ